MTRKIPRLRSKHVDPLERDVPPEVPQEAVAVQASEEVHVTKRPGVKAYEDLIQKMREIYGEVPTDLEEPLKKLEALL